MTLGIDVSRLFTEMIMVILNNIDRDLITTNLIFLIHTNIFYTSQAIETKDVVIKKMVYLYLCTYAHKQPDMALMSMNSLLRDW